MQFVCQKIVFRKEFGEALANRCENDVPDDTDPEISDLCCQIIITKISKGNKIMKKLLIVAAAACVALAVTGCGSMRTPTSGSRSQNVYYKTFFGISIESAVYGDGLVVGRK